MKRKRAFRKASKILLFLAIDLLAMFCAGELYLRCTGYQLSHFPKDASVGWHGNPGTIQSDEDPTVFEHVWPNNQRASHSMMGAKKKARKRAAAFGDSWTYGGDVRDEDTWVWHLNELFDDVEFDNCGAGGYSSYQAYLRMKRELEATHYDLVLYGAWRGQVTRCLNYDSENHMICDIVRSDIPWAELRDGKLIEHPATASMMSYNQRSYLISFIRRVRAGMFTSHYATVEDEYTLSLFKAMVAKMHDLASAHGARLLVCILEEYPEYDFDSIIPDDVERVHLMPEGLNEPLNATKYRVRGVPHFHPNGWVHNYWAKGIEKYLREHDF